MARAPRVRVALLLASVWLLGCAPKLRLPPVEIPKLKKLKHVMDVQETVADPQFKKIKKAEFDDEDFAGFLDAGEVLVATSLKAKEFSRGPLYDKFADRLNEKAAALAAAAAAKDAPAARYALIDIKATCKACHAKF